jgi:putative sterol carrier protein
MLFGSEEWIKAFMDEINNSEAYAEAAVDWEGDFYFIIESGKEDGEAIYYYADLWHGKCREAYRVPDENARDPAFRLSAPLATWELIVEGKLDPIPAMMSRKLSVQGNLVKIVRSVRAAQELVACVARVKTEFPTA